MATQAVTSGAKKNNSGTIKKGGNIASNSPITVSRSLMDDAIATTYGAQLSVSAHLGTYNAMTTFAYKMVAGQYIMKKNTPYVNGVASTILTSGAADFGLRKSIAKRESTHALGVNSWNAVTGAITKGGTAGDEVTFKQSGGTKTDDAATPTRAVPGELTYKTGALLPTSDEYKPRTG